MRSASSAFVLALAVLAGCGNLSNEDVAFVEAMPSRDQLHVTVPQSASQPLCGPGTFGDAEVWKSAKTSGASTNAGVDAILSLVDAVRTAPPTTRDTDSRAWGPFPDDKHPGVIILVTMSRELDPQGVPWRWLYSFGARRPPADYLPILEGEFYGAQARNGDGRLTLHFENSIKLGMNNPGDPNAPARIFYDLSGDPRTISLDLTDGTFGSLARYDYFYAGYADGHGQFDYSWNDPRTNCPASASSRFTARGAGKVILHVDCGVFFQGDVTQCFDSEACITYVNDPFAITPACGTTKPCLLGAATSCSAQ